MRAFQLARGYSPSILRLPTTDVPERFLIAPKCTAAARTLQKVLRTQNNHLTSPQALKSGTTIWLYYKTSKQNDPVRWVKAKFIGAIPFYVRGRRSDRGPPMKLAYEHVRLLPEGSLAKAVQTVVLEDVLADHVSDTVSEEEAQPEGSEPAKVMLNVLGPENSDFEINEASRTRSSFFAGTVSGDPWRDIGQTRVRGSHSEQSTDLTTNKQQLLNQVEDVLRKAQVTRNKMECAPSCMLDKAVD